MTKAERELLLTVAKMVRTMVSWNGVRNKYESIKSLDRHIKEVEWEKKDERTRGC